MIHGINAEAMPGATDTEKLQAAVTKAFNLPGGTVLVSPRLWTIDSTLTLPDLAGTVRLQGLGKPKGLDGGNSGDPFAAQGTQMKYTGTTGDIFSTVLTGSNKRQYIAIEDIEFLGNIGGTNGHGLHFQTASPTCGLLVSLRDVSVMKAKQHGIFFDGNVFESELYNVRSNQNGDRGFKCAANGSTIPGEIDFYSSMFQGNSVGVDLSGGGHISFHGMSCNSNTNQGLIANGVKLEGLRLQLESNGGGGIPQASLTLQDAQLLGVLLSDVAGQAVGMQFLSAFRCLVRGLQSNGLATTTIAFDNASQDCELVNPSASVTWSLGTGTGHIVRRGGTFLTGRGHSVGTQNVAGGTSGTPDAQQYDVYRIMVTSAGTITVNNPIGTSAAAMDGQDLTVEIINSSGGVIGVNWQGSYEFDGASAPTVPANGKRRRIRFVYDRGRAIWSEVARSTADI